MKDFFRKITAFFLSIWMSIFGLFSIKRLSPQPEEPPVQERLGAYICGVCHPDENYALIKDAGFSWVRFDIPYPYNKDGSISAKYAAFKSRAEGYARQGIKVLAITPYPKYYFSIGGFDPSVDENAERTKEIAVFLCNDLRNIIGGLQITNEMGVSSFTTPLTLKQAAKFIGIQAQAISAVKGDLIVGYNSAGIGEKLHRLMQPYLPYMDYVGVDLYYGTLGNGSLQDYVSGVERAYQLTKKPILLTEFGFASAGEPKSAEERAAVLARYGYDSEEAARADIESFIAKLPGALKAQVYQGYPDPSTWGDAVFVDMANHFYGYLDASMPGILHTPQGQAAFYRQLLPLLKQTNCLAGFFAFYWRDSGVCKLCGQDDCPYKSAWGLTDANGAPKNAYYAVKEALAA